MNKQRITKLSPAEIQASIAATDAAARGAVDDAIPEEAIGMALDRFGRRAFDRAAIFQALRNRARMNRLMARAGHLEPAEIVKQARDTAAVIDELLLRLEHLHPDLVDRADETLMYARGDFIGAIQERIELDLKRVRVALQEAGDAIAAQPMQKGPKSTWPSMRDEIADILRQHSSPPLPKREAKELAAEILALCGLADPRA